MVSLKKGEESFFCFFFNLNFIFWLLFRLGKNWLLEMSLIHLLYTLMMKKSRCNGKNKKTKKEKKQSLNWCVIFFFFFADLII